MTHPTKPAFESKNIPSANISAIAQLFPSCITESRGEDGKLKQTVDFEKLRALLGNDIAQGDESYDFTWVGKKAAMQEAGIPVRKTLRPCTEESRDWDTTQNLYIEGDNLDVLKLLQESYLKKVKMIYIDPPYNTGNDFIYNDHFETDKNEYEEGSGAVDENGDNLFLNTETNGRFHSDWCSMMYSRLVLARNLLADNGAIFISIDDNEVDNLRKIADEVFGINNFVAMLTIVVKPEGRRYGFFAKSHEYTIVYGKNVNCLSMNEIEVEGNSFQYKDNFGGFNLRGLRNRNVQAFNSDNRPNLRYPFFVDIKKPTKDGMFSVSVEKKQGFEEVYPSTIDGLESVWRWGKDKSNANLKDLIAYKGNDNKIRIFQKERKLTQTAKTVWFDKEIISNKGTKEVQDIIGKGIFNFPKPVSLIRIFLEIGADTDSIILDFFSGSATTAHAVMQLNAEDGGNRKFIMVQLPEKCAEDSEAYKAGYKTICDIGKERIRRAGDKIKTEMKSNAEGKKQNAESMKNDAQLTLESSDKELANSASSIPNSELDIGFRVFKVDDSNMKDVYYSAEETSQKMLSGLESNIKDDRTDMDLLYGCLLDWGLPLSLPHTSETIDGVTVHTVNNGDLIACFNADIPESAIRTIAQRKPLRAVFRDSSFATSPEKINVTEIFKTISPTTGVKVI